MYVMERGWAGEWREVQ